MRIMNKKQYEQKFENELIIDEKFKGNDVHLVGNHNSYSGLCHFCHELIRSESQRVPLKISPTKQKVAHRNCIETYTRQHGEVNV